MSTNIATFPLRAFGGYPQSVASGAGTDQNVWFTLAGNGGVIYYRDPLDTTVHGEYTIPTSDSGPGPIAAGPDGKYWFFEEAADQFGVIDPSTGKINEIPLLSTDGATVMGITAGPNNTVWFTENNRSQIGMIDTSTDEITEFPTMTPGSQPYGITQGPDGNIWFTEAGANKVGMINVTTDVVTEFTIDPSGNDDAEGITVGPGNNLWFTLTGASKIGEMNPQDGSMVAEYGTKTANAQPVSITFGPDKNLWITESAVNNIGMITAAGTMSEYPAVCCNSNPVSIISGSDQNLWFAGSKYDGVQTINASSHQITTFNYLTTSAVPVTGITASSNGNIWFTQQSADQVGVFFPSTDMSAEEYAPTANAGPLGIAYGPDGNLWFAEFGYNSNPGDRIGMINSSNTSIAEGTLTTTNAQPFGIIADPTDGNLWFTEWAANKVGSINAATKKINEYNLPTAKAFPESIAVDAAGNVWFTEGSVKKIAMLSPGNPSTITEYTVPGSAHGIVAGPDGNIWFTENIGSVYEIAVFSPSSHTVIARYTVTGSTGLNQITVGPDQNLWFTDSSGKIGMITTAGTITEYPVPSATPYTITSSPDGNIWFGATGVTGSPNVIGVVTLSDASNPTKLALLTQPPSSVAAGNGFGLVVSVENSAGNPTLDYNGTVTIALAKDPTGATLDGTLTATVHNGLATFPGVSLAESGAGYTIRATSGILTQATSNAIDVNSIAASQLVLGQQPTDAVAGVALGPAVTVKVEDKFHNLVTTDGSMVTLTLSTGSFEGGSKKATSLASSGVATFGGLKIDRAGTYTLSASNAFVEPSGPSNAFTISPAAASQLVIQIQPSPGATAGQTFTTQPVIDEEDQYGNLETADNTTVITAEPDGIGLLLGATATVRGGVARFSSLANETAESASITFHAGGLNSFLTNPITVNSAVADHLTVATSFASPDVAGTVGTVTVTAKDHFGNIAGSGPNQYEGTVNLGTADAQAVVLPASHTFTANDAGSFTVPGVVLKTAGNQTITAADSLAGAIMGSTSVNVTAAAAQQLIFASPPPDSITAGQSFTLFVSAEDPFHNLDPNYDGIVTISLSNSSFTATVQASKGVATFTGLTLDVTTSGSVIQATALGLTSATSNPIKVEPAALPPPTVLSEQVVSIVKVNKKGKKVGKPVPGFRFVFSTAMSASAGLPADYHVFSTVIKRLKRKTITISKPVKFTTSYNQATNSVTLSVKSKHPFSKGGQITMTGVTDQAGVPLNPIYAIFNIEPKANTITLGSHQELGPLT